MKNGMGSALLVPALRLPALPDAAAPAPASQQDARVPLPAPGDDCDVSMDLTAERRFEQTFEARAEQHFGSRLVEYERNMAERTWQEVERTVRRSRVRSRLWRRTMPSWLLRRTLPLNSAIRQTVREEFDGYRVHLATEMQEDIPAHVEARIADVCDFFRSSSTRVPAGWNSMPARTVKCLQRHCVRRRIAS